MTDRVLATGVTGFVGSHVLDHLLERDDQVIGVGSLRRNGTSDHVLDVLTGHLSLDHDYEHVVHDLSAPFSPQQLERIGKVDQVVNVASLCSVDQSIADPVGFVRNNIDLTLNVLEFARGMGAGWLDRFVHLSTDEVHGRERPCGPFHFQPSSPYAASKAAQEAVCHAYHVTYGVPTTVVTSVNMFGERQSCLAFVPRIVRALLEDRPVTVHVSDGVPGSRGYTYVGDVARVLVDAAKSRATPRDTYLKLGLPAAARVDNLTMVKLVGDMLGVVPTIESVEVATVRPGYDPSYGYDGDVVAVGYTDFEVALEHTVRWFRDNPRWLA